MFVLSSLEIQFVLEQALEKIGEIARHLHQMTDLEALLNYGVQEIQDLFESDRVLVYQFLPNGDGIISAESVRDGWEPIIGRLIYDPCFQTQWAEQYRQGRVKQVADVETSELAPCHIEFLTQLQVKANLVVPIIIKPSDPVGNKEPILWGLLIVQQCSTPRSWHSLEVQLLKHLTIQLEIAIAHLEAQQQWQVTLHQQVAAAHQANQAETSIGQTIAPHEAADRLIAQQERDRFFINAHDIMAIADQNGTITLANLAWQTVLGYSPQEVIGVRFIDIFHPDDISSALHVFQQHLRTQQPVHNREYRCRHCDGSYRWISWSAFCYNGMSYGFGRDITQQKQLETSLTQEEERWQLAIQGSNDGIWDWNIVTGELFLSQRWNEMLGYSKDEVEHVLESWESRVHPEDLGRVKQTIHDHLTCKTPFFEVEHRMRCKDGTYKWILARAQAVWNATGQAIRMVGFHTDISDRKQAAQELQHSIEELIRLNHLKDDFLSTVSHELRTPMSNIRMATQMLEIRLKSMGILADESNSINRYFQILKTECQRETQLINDLLNLTHLEAGTEPLTLTTVDLPFLIPQIAEPFVERSQQQQQHFEIEIPDHHPSINTDVSYLEWMIAELLNNACKYSPVGENICLTIQVTPKTLEIIVSNSGVEIAEIERDRIFDKFYRIPNHDPWQHGGTGLGLTLVQKMVNRLGGTITVSSSSQPSMTTFTVHLPCNPTSP